PPAVHIPIFPPSLLPLPSPPLPSPPLRLPLSSPPPPLPSPPHSTRLLPFPPLFHLSSPFIRTPLPLAVLLAPLRYGAGIKGKVLDSWRHGTPVVTTPIGAEGMGCRGGGEEGEEPGEGDTGVAEGQGEGGAGEQWGGLWGPGDAEAFAADAVRLYSDPHLWASCQSTVHCLPSLPSVPTPPAALPALHCLPCTACLAFPLPALTTLSPDLTTPQI
ncbi:unnamed protein product, partial [Closterium sp. NIES-54]